jgi:alpha-ribazole phosphatase
VKLFVVRHAAPAVAGVCYGQSDIPVVTPHEEAAATVCESLGRESFGTIVSSPFERALGLGQAIARRLGKDAPQIDARLSELSFGEWEGRTFAEIESADSERFSAWMARYTELAAPGGETVAELDARVRGFVADLRGTSSSDLVVVAHAGVTRALRRLRDGTSWEQEMSRPVPYLGITELDLEALG